MTVSSRLRLNYVPLDSLSEELAGEYEKGSFGGMKASIFGTGGKTDWRWWV